MRAAAARSKRSHRPAVIVTPERDTPGWSASACATSHDHGVARLEVVDGAVAAEPVDDQEEGAEEDQHHPDEDRVAEPVLDLAREQRTGDRARDRGQQQQPRDPSVGLREGAPAHRSQPGDEVHAQIVAEVPHGGDERAHVQRDVERLVQLRVGRDARSSRGARAPG